MMRPHFGAAVFFYLIEISYQIKKYARIGQMNMCACSCGGCRDKGQGLQEPVLFFAIRR